LVVAPVGTAISPIRWPVHSKLDVEKGESSGERSEKSLEWKTDSGDLDSQESDEEKRGDESSDEEDEKSKEEESSDVSVVEQSQYEGSDSQEERMVRESRDEGSDSQDEDSMDSMNKGNSSDEEYILLYESRQRTLVVSPIHPQRTLVVSPIRPQRTLVVSPIRPLMSLEVYPIRQSAVRGPFLSPSLRSTRHRWSI
jgi:hypothetical protein